MLNRFFGAQFHTHFHYFVLLLFFVGVCCSTFLMSMGLLLGGLNFLLNAQFASYWQHLKTNRFFWLIALFFVLHLVGLLWSTDWHYGLDDIRKKSSLLVIPLLVCSQPFPPLKIRNRLLWAFILTLLITSIINFICYSFYREQLHIIDIRGLSLFGSHIRYGILIALGVGVCFELIKSFQKAKYLLITIALWLTFYTYFSQVLSGVVALLIVFIVLFFYRLSSKNRIILGVSGGIIVVLFGAWLYQYLAQPIAFKSKNRNEQSMKQAWEKKSQFAYDSLDLRQQQLATTLERYLSSKNLAANGEGIAALTPIDIRNIEEGFADIHETENGLMARLYGIRYQLHHAGNPNGHSILERLEYWKNSWQIIQDNWLFGVGTGDVEKEILKMYDKRHSPLELERRHRTHNSYLTFWLTFGIFGLLYFIYFQLDFLRFQLKNKQVLGVLFILIALATFFFEDTLETQMGITFFALFYAHFSRTEINVDILHS